MKKCKDELEKKLKRACKAIQIMEMRKKRAEFSWQKATDFLDRLRAEQKVNPHAELEDKIYAAKLNWILEDDLFEDAKIAHSKAVKKMNAIRLSYLRSR